jgi:cysteine desulfurase
MHVNSEIGAIQPIGEVVEVLKDYPNIKFHVDATQSFGNLDLDVTGIDCLTFSAHKIGGLQSSGFIYIKDNVNIVPLFHGGSHERGKRAGTQSVALGASVAKAIRVACDTRVERYKNVVNINETLRNELEGYVVFNSSSTSSPYILNMSVPGVKPETILHSLEDFGIYISTKSACSSRSSNISRVIDEITHDETLASSSFRLSFYDNLENDDIMYIAKSLKTVINRLKEVVS